MKQQERWLLPIGMADLAAPESWHIEQLRHELLQKYRALGYDLIHPSLVEYTDSLLTASGEDLALETCQFLDADSHRMLGVRADMTPQVARIDARETGEVIRQYCYSNLVLRSKTSLLQSSRTPLQTGVEIFGNPSVAADEAVIQLAIESLQHIGLSNLTLDIGHVGIYRHVISQCDYLLGAPNIHAQLFSIIQRKSQADLHLFLDNNPKILPKVKEKLQILIGVHGTNIVQLAEYTQQIFECEASQNINILIQNILKNNNINNNINIHYDLTELHGYRYQTGVVFGIYAPNQGREIARGGRYDDIGAAFGRARAATGFSFDLVEAARLAAR